MGAAVVHRWNVANGRNTPNVKGSRLVRGFRMVRHREPGDGVTLFPTRSCSNPGPGNDTRVECSSGSNRRCAGVSTSFLMVRSARRRVRASHHARPAPVRCATRSLCSCPWYPDRRVSTDEPAQYAMAADRMSPQPGRVHRSSTAGCPRGLVARAARAGAEVGTSLAKRLNPTEWSVVACCTDPTRVIPRPALPRRE